MSWHVELFPIPYATTLDEGIAAYRSGHYEVARVLLEQALVEQPGCYQALMALGNLHLDWGKAYTAAYYFTRALREDAYNGTLLIQLSECLRLAGDETGAERVYERAVEAWSGEPPAPPPPVKPGRPSRPIARGTRPLGTTPWAA